MKSILAIALFVVLAGVANAQVVPANALAARSVSGQFLVYAPPAGLATRVPPGLVNNSNYVELQPALLTISCERIKLSLQRELGTPAAWSGKIHLTLRPAQGGDDPVNVFCQRFREGWMYRVELPQFVERRRFTRALVQVLLLEQANRRIGTRSAEIPTWLVEGLTQHLLSSREMEFILPPPNWNLRGLTIGPTVDTRRYGPLNAARGPLRDRTPLTLEELSWPTEEQLDGAPGENYRRSAQLFVTELLRLKNGRACLRTMIEELGQNYNWQTAFFRAFGAHFTRQLDLEKWWALQVVHFTGRDPAQLWTVGESWRQLEQTLQAPVEIRRTTNDLPARATVTLQAVIREWDLPQQTPMLKNKMRDLDLLRQRTAPELTPLLDDYQRTLKAYLQRRDRVDLTAFLRRGGSRQLHPAARETIKQLDALDARRATMRPKESPATLESALGKTTAP